jgi:hypothetical protein
VVIFEVTDYPRYGSIKYNKKHYGFNEILEKNNTVPEYGYLHNNELVNFKFNSPFLWKTSLLSSVKNKYNELAYQDAKDMINSKKKIVLCVSGGIDSEFMLQSFLPFSKDVRVVFFNYGVNTEDKEDIVNRNIYQTFDIEFMDIDAEKFFSSHLDLIYGFKYRTSFPEAMLFLYALDCIQDHNSCYVLSGDIPEPRLIKNSLNFSFVSDNICAIDRWAHINDTTVVSSFMLNNLNKINSILSILSSPKYLNFNYNLKKEFYKDLGYDIELRNKKYTGLENLRKMQNIWKYSAIIEKFKKLEFDNETSNFLESNSHLLK